MKNNYWEELDMTTDILKFHTEVLEQMKIPEWMLIKCPFCEKQLSAKSVRKFGLCLNTRNLGDLFVEFICDTCDIMDTVYFRQNVENVSELVGYLNGTWVPASKPIVEENMYKLQYNNAVEKMTSKLQQKET